MSPPQDRAVFRVTPLRPKNQFVIVARGGPGHKRVIVEFEHARRMAAALLRQLGGIGMPMKATWCPVLGTEMVQVTDFEGAVTNILCPEYDPDGTCRLKKSAAVAGPVARLLRRMPVVNTRRTLCMLRGA
jgi:hypothetical protein